MYGREEENINDSKKIHYCWVGGNPIPEQFKKYIEIWKKNCPDYKIIEWNEKNYDFTKIPYMKEAYEAKKWGFVPDYARLDIIYQHGGIYLDTDVELVHSLDSLLELNGFAGFESQEWVNFGQGFGAEAGNDSLKYVMDRYLTMHFVNDDGTYNMTPSPQINTISLTELGLIRNGRRQDISDFTFLPAEYFNPYNWATGRIKVTKHTIGIHHYAATWMDEGAKKNNIERHNYEIIRKKYGKRVADIYSYLFWCKKENGGTGVLNALLQRLKK